MTLRIRCNSFALRRQATLLLAIIVWHHQPIVQGTTDESEARSNNCDSPQPDGNLYLPLLNKAKESSQGAERKVDVIVLVASTLSSRRKEYASSAIRRALRAFDSTEDRSLATSQAGARIAVAYVNHVGTATTVFESCSTTCADIHGVNLNASVLFPASLEHVTQKKPMQCCGAGASFAQLSVNVVNSLVISDCIASKHSHGDCPQRVNNSGIVTRTDASVVLILLEESESTRRKHPECSLPDQKLDCSSDDTEKRIKRASGQIDTTKVLSGLSVPISIVVLSDAAASDSSAARQLGNPACAHTYLDGSNFNKQVTYGCLKERFQEDTLQGILLSCGIKFHVASLGSDRSDRLGRVLVAEIFHNRLSTDTVFNTSTSSFEHVANPNTETQEDAQRRFTDFDGTTGQTSSNVGIESTIHLPKKVKVVDIEASTDVSKAIRAVMDRMEPVFLNAPTLTSTWPLRTQYSTSCF